MLLNLVDYFGGGTFDYVDIVSIGISNQTAEQVLLFMNLVREPLAAFRLIIFITSFN